jgi:hypothetical protein
MIVVLIRFAACLLGLFALSTGVMDILGLFPHSNEMPPWRSRLVSSLPSMLGGVILLAPMSRFLHGRRYRFLVAGYWALVLATLVMAAQGVYAYTGGTKHWAIIPVSLALFAVPFGNALLLWWLHLRETRLPQLDG